MISPLSVEKCSSEPCFLILSLTFLFIIFQHLTTPAETLRLQTDGPTVNGLFKDHVEGDRQRCGGLNSEKVKYRFLTGLAEMYSK